MHLSRSANIQADDNALLLNMAEGISALTRRPSGVTGDHHQVDTRSCRYRCGIVFT
jgi:hypothetical protein